VGQLYDRPRDVSQFDLWHVSGGDASDIFDLAEAAEALRAEAVPANAWRQAISELVGDPKIERIAAEAALNLIEQRAIAISKGEG
jgi:hypothetical protein